jgi:hypothetical protein
MNDIHTHAHSSPNTKAWRTLSQCLPTLDPNCNHWWQLTSRHLVALVDAIDYLIEKQYEALLMHYHWTIDRSLVEQYFQRSSTL